MAGRARPTVGVVADRAGVSVASVSRVLNGLPASPAMTARVQAAAGELGYVPDVIARSLKVRRTGQLAFAVADVGNPVYVQMMHAVDEVVRAAGYRLVISSIGPDPADAITQLDSLAYGFADGLVLSPLRFDDQLVKALTLAHTPVVLIGTPPDTVDVDHVRADSHRGVRIALDHLHQSGRRRVAFLNVPVDTVPGSARSRAFTAAVTALGMVDDPSLRATAADFTVEAGRVAARELLGRSRPDAVLAANDLLAVGVLQVAAELDVDVPGELAVVGMDNSELAALVSPALSSVDLGSAERGRLAAELILDRLGDPDRRTRRLVVEPALVVRRSSAPATVAPSDRVTA